MFYKPEKYIIPPNRRQTKRIQLNNSEAKTNFHMPKLNERLRENKNIFIRDSMNVADINGIKSKKYYQSKIKDIMNIHKGIKGAEPKTTKPKRYNENNSFDYSDVNISRRVIRKMVHSSLFDHKPYERAKYIDKVSLGNKFINRIDPVDVANPNKSMSAFDKPRPLYQSLDMRGSSMSEISKLNKTLEAPLPEAKTRYKMSRRQNSMYSNHLAQSMHSLSPGETGSLKDFHS